MPAAEKLDTSNQFRYGTTTSDMCVGCACSNATRNSKSESSVCTVVVIGIQLEHNKLAWKCQNRLPLLAMAMMSPQSTPKRHYQQFLMVLHLDRGKRERREYSQEWGREIKRRRVLSRKTIILSLVSHTAYPQWSFLRLLVSWWVVSLPSFRRKNKST